MKKILSTIYRLLKYCYNKQRYDDYRRKYNIDPSFEFNGDDIFFLGEGEIHIAENTYLGQSSQIYADKDQNVIIGMGCSISHYVRIYTSSRNPKQTNKYKKGNVFIGDHCFIGYGAIILQGVRIGDNCIIGANAVITEDISDNTTVKPLMITRHFYGGKGIKSSPCQTLND